MTQATIVLGKAKTFYTKWTAVPNADGTITCTKTGNFTSDEKKAQDSGLEFIPCLQGANLLTIQKTESGYEVVGGAPKTAKKSTIKVAEIKDEFADMPIVLGKGAKMFIAFAVSTATDENGITTKTYYSLGNAGTTIENARAKYPMADATDADETLNGGKVIFRKYNESGVLLSQMSETQHKAELKKAEKLAKATETATAETATAETATAEMVGETTEG